LNFGLSLTENASDHLRQVLQLKARRWKRPKLVDPQKMLAYLGLQHCVALRGADVVRDLALLN
jgi:hypothetical protein